MLTSSYSFLSQEELCQHQLELRQLFSTMQSLEDARSLAQLGARSRPPSRPWLSRLLFHPFKSANTLPPAHSKPRIAPLMLCPWYFLAAVTRLSPWHLLLSSLEGMERNQSRWAGEAVYSHTGCSRDGGMDHTAGNNARMARDTVVEACQGDRCESCQYPPGLRRLPPSAYL